MGVNTAIATGAEGIGFAVPADTVRDIVPELLRHGNVERASLGVSIAPRRVDAMDRVVVTAVRSTAVGPFEKGDALLTVGGHDIHSQQDLLRILRRDMVDCSVPMTVLRDGRRVEFHCRPVRLM